MSEEEQRIERADGEVCPACATEWEAGTMKECGGSLVAQAQKLRIEKQELERKLKGAREALDRIADEAQLGPDDLFYKIARQAIEELGK